MSKAFNIFSSALCSCGLMSSMPVEAKPLAPKRYFGYSCVSNKDKGPPFSYKIDMYLKSVRNSESEGFIKIYDHKGLPLKTKVEVVNGLKFNRVQPWPSEKNPNPSPLIVFSVGESMKNRLGLELLMLVSFEMSDSGHSNEKPSSATLSLNQVDFSAKCIPLRSE